jgi:hypothetical protein
MELASLFLLVLLPPADATGDTAVAIQATLRRELGEVTMVIAPDTVVTPTMWQGEKAQMRARFVARVTWKGRDQASIELLAPDQTSAGQGARSSRQLTFDAQDGKSERGRAMGLVLAALLRESPASIWLAPRPAGEVAAAGAGAHQWLVLGAMFAAEWARTGNWPMGPELLYDLSLTDSFRVRASAVALFGGLDSYQEMGVGLGGSWDFLHSQDGHRALGAGLKLDVFHEATNAPGDNVKNGSTWNAALGPTLGGRITVWRSLRLIGETSLRASLARMTLTVGEDIKKTYTYSRWRPVFAVGLEYAL